MLQSLWFFEEREDFFMDFFSNEVLDITTVTNGRVAVVKEISKR